MLLSGTTLWRSTGRYFTTMSIIERKYQSGKNVVVFVTVPDEQVGRTLARGLVTEKLAACVNIMPKIASIYEWEGKLEEDIESMLMIKTASSKMDELTTFVKSNHPYDVPEIENGNQDYLKWISDIVQK